MGYTHYFNINEKNEEDFDNLLNKMIEISFFQAIVAEKSQINCYNGIFNNNEHETLFGEAKFIKTNRKNYDLFVSIRLKIRKEKNFIYEVNSDDSNSKFEESGSLYDATPSEKKEFLILYEKTKDYLNGDIELEDFQYFPNLHQKIIEGNTEKSSVFNIYNKLFEHNKINLSKNKRFYSDSLEKRNYLYVDFTNDEKPKDGLEDFKKSESLIFLPKTFRISPYMLQENDIININEHNYQLIKFPKNKNGVFLFKDENNKNKTFSYKEFLNFEFKNQNLNNPNKLNIKEINIDKNESLKSEEKIDIYKNMEQDFDLI